MSFNFYNTRAFVRIHDFLKYVLLTYRILLKVDFRENKGFDLVSSTKTITTMESHERISALALKTNPHKSPSSSDRHFKLFYVDLYYY